MTKTIIFTIAAMTALFVFSFGIMDIYAPTKPDLVEGVSGQAIPGWVDNNFRWYAEGLIEQTDLLNSLSFLLDNGHMHLSDKAAKEMHDLRVENEQLHQQMAHYDGVKVTAKSQGMMQKDPSMMYGDKPMTKDDAINHLRNAYDLDPNLETKVVQYDKDHDKWIDVLSVDMGKQHSMPMHGSLDVWVDGNQKTGLTEREFVDMLHGMHQTHTEVCMAADQSSDEKSSCWVRVAQTHAGDPDRPMITGQVPNSDKPTEEVAFYYKKISTAYDTIDDIINKGGSESAWEDGIDRLSGQDSYTRDSVVDELAGIVVLCSTAIDKEILKLQAEVAVLEELQDRLSDSTTRSDSSQYGESDLEFISRHAGQVDTKILSLQTGLSVLEDKLDTIGDDAQLANLDLQNALQKQQQSLQTLSSITKSMHGTKLTAITTG